MTTRHPLQALAMLWRAFWTPRRTQMSAMAAINRERLRIRGRLGLMLDRERIRTEQNMPTPPSMKWERELLIARLEELDVIAVWVAMGYRE